MGKTRKDKAYERGVRDGQRGDLLEDFTMGWSFGDLIPGSEKREKEWEAYKKGYEYGVDHRYGPEGRYHTWDNRGTNDPKPRREETKKPQGGYSSGGGAGGGEGCFSALLGGCFNLFVLPPLVLTVVLVVVGICVQCAGVFWETELKPVLPVHVSCEENVSSGTKTCVADVENKISKLKKLIERDELAKRKLPYASLYRSSLLPADYYDYTAILRDKKIEILSTGGIDDYHYSSQRINLADESPPVCSPDGKIVVFAENDGYIYLMSRNGRNILKIAKGYSPRWSSDGKKIVFTRR